MAKRINETPILRGEDARRFEELARTAHLRTVSPDIMKRMKENYERMNAAMVRSESKWIPCSDRLPEMVPDGIGWSKSEEVLAMYIDADIRYCKVAYCRTTPEGHIQWIGIKATHWMPLPEAP